MTHLARLGSPASEAWPSFCTFLTEELHYPLVLRKSDTEYAAIYPLAFTTAIITGDIGDRTGIYRRYCYHTAYEAEMALVRWWARDFAGEPMGWHRDTLTARRRPDGDPKREYVRG